jgi:hypothetical protein
MQETLESITPLLQAFIRAHRDWMLSKQGQDGPWNEFGMIALLAVTNTLAKKFVECGASSEGMNSLAEVAELVSKCLQTEMAPGTRAEYDA